jgi:RNA polymerase sigma-70 factor (ECF subfamily)
MITSFSKTVHDNKVVMLVEPRSDNWSELLSQVGASQDRDSFTRIFEHFAPLVKGFLMKGGSVGPEHAEELAQEALFKVWHKAASFDRKKSAASTWIYTIARNCRIDWLRREMRKKKDIQAEDLYDIDEDTNSNFSSLEQLRNRDKVRQKLAGLPLEQMEVVTKIYYEGKSHSEVANELSLPLGTVKSRIRLALKRMQVRLSQEEA